MKIYVLLVLAIVATTAIGLLTALNQPNLKALALDELQIAKAAVAPVGQATARQSRASVNLPAGTMVKAEIWAQSDIGNRNLFNNTWGATSNESLASAVYLGQNGSYGWYWDRPQPQLKEGMAFLQPLYPSIRIGGSPWDKSGLVEFPVKAGDIKSLKLDLAYGYPVAPTDTYDLAYDIFFTDVSNPCPKSGIKAEVMIWLQGTKGQPDGSYKGDYSDGQDTYKLYSWIMKDGRAYYAFILQGTPQFSGKHSVDAAKLISNLNLDPDWYVPGIELGNEVWQGSGRIEISNLTVILNGDSL